MEQMIACGDAIGEFKQIVCAHGMGDSILIRGSAALGAFLVPFWSDIDVTFFVKSADRGALEKIRVIRQEYEARRKDISLSIAVVNADDSIEHNYFHHHGVKPLSYNLQLSLLQGIKLPFHLNREALRESSLYRYYEILYTFRRDVVKSERFTAEMVAKGFHRLSYLLRCQIEFIDPSLIMQHGDVPREEYCRLLPAHVVDTFFQEYVFVKSHWATIRQHRGELQRLGAYLIDIFDLVHKAFLPLLQEEGKLHAYNP